MATSDQRCQSCHHTTQPYRDVAPEPGPATVPTQPWAPGTNYSQPQPPIPAITTTVVITALFGLFGLIPATQHTNRARDMGVRTGKYWKAFGWTMGASTAAWILFWVILFAIAGAASSSLNDSYYGSLAVPTTAAGQTTEAAPALVPQTFTVEVLYIKPEWQEMPGAGGVPVGTELLISSDTDEGRLDSTTVKLSKPPNSSGQADPLPGAGASPYWQLTVTLKVPADSPSYVPYSENTWTLNAVPVAPLPNGRDTLYMNPPSSLNAAWEVR